jgi:hypothetical protein
MARTQMCCTCCVTITVPLWLGLLHCELGSVLAAPVVLAGLGSVTSISKS